MKHIADPDFWAHYSSLPAEKKSLAARNFKMLRAQQNHAGLNSGDAPFAARERHFHQVKITILAPMLCAGMRILKSMQKMADAGKQHHHFAVVGGFDDGFVPAAAARLNNRRYAAIAQQFHRIGKRKESVGCRHCSFQF